MSWNYKDAVLAYRYFGDDKPKNDNVTIAKHGNNTCQKHHCNRKIHKGTIQRIVTFDKNVIYRFCDRCCDYMAEETAGYLPEGKDDLK